MQRIAKARHLQLTNQWQIVMCVQTENQVNCRDKLSWLADSVQCMWANQNRTWEDCNETQNRVGRGLIELRQLLNSVTKLNRCHKTFNRCHKQREENWEWELGTNWDGEVKAATRETGSADDAGAGDILVPMPVLYNCVLSHLLIWGQITQVAIYFLNLICESGLVGNVSIYSVCPRVSRPQFYNGIYGHCLFVTHLTHLREHLNIIVGIANVVQSQWSGNNWIQVLNCQNCNQCLKCHKDWLCCCHCLGRCHYLLSCQVLSPHHMNKSERSQVSNIAL